MLSSFQLTRIEQLEKLSGFEFFCIDPRIPHAQLPMWYGPVVVTYYRNDELYLERLGQRKTLRQVCLVYPAQNPNPNEVN